MKKHTKKRLVLFMLIGVLIIGCASENKEIYVSNSSKNVYTGINTSSMSTNDVQYVEVENRETHIVEFTKRLNNYMEINGQAVLVEDREKGKHVGVYPQGITFSVDEDLKISEIYYSVEIGNVDEKYVLFLNGSYEYTIKKGLEEIEEEGIILTESFSTEITISN